jgi:RNA polymerase sigma-70 factor, ECF subfamily
VSPMEDKELTSLVDQALEAQASEQNADDLLDRKEALRECMARIDEKSRKLIIRFYRDAWSFDQMSAWLGRSANALRVNVSRIRQSLRVCIEKRLAAAGVQA